MRTEWSIVDQFTVGPVEHHRARRMDENYKSTFKSGEGRHSSSEKKKKDPGPPEVDDRRGAPTILIVSALKRCLQSSPQGSLSF